LNTPVFHIVFPADPSNLVNLECTLFWTAGIKGLKHGIGVDVCRNFLCRCVYEEALVV